MLSSPGLSIREPGRQVASRAALRNTGVIVAALFCLALLPRLFWVWSQQFDGLYGQDAYAYYGYAVQLFDALTHLRPPPPFWWPLGYPALLALSFLLLGVGTVPAQLVTMLAGASLAPLAFLLTSEADDGRRFAGLIAGLLLAFAGQAVQSSVVIMADAPAAAWALLSAWLLLRYRRTNAPFALYGSALGLGLALLTRWENVILVPAWLVCLALTIRTRGNLGFRPAVLALILFALVLGPQLAYQLTSGAAFAGESWLEGWRPGNMLLRSFDTADGHFWYVLPVALFYGQVFFHPAYLFPLLTPFLLAGAWSLLRSSSRNLEAAVLLLGWIAIGFVSLAGIPYENFRFGLAYFPPVAAVAGIGLAATWRYLRERRSPGRISSNCAAPVSAAAAYLAPILLVGSLAGMALWQPRVLAPFLQQKRMELDNLEWLTARVPPGAPLFAFGMTEALRHYGHWQVADLSEQSPLDGENASPGPAYVFVDVNNVEVQWNGHPLQATFDALRATGLLRELDRRDPWTLFAYGP